MKQTIIKAAILLATLGLSGWLLGYLVAGLVVIPMLLYGDSWCPAVEPSSPWGGIFLVWVSVLLVGATTFFTGRALARQKTLLKQAGIALVIVGAAIIAVPFVFSFFVWNTERKRPPQVEHFDQARWFTLTDNKIPMTRDLIMDSTLWRADKQTVLNLLGTHQSWRAVGNPDSLARLEYDVQDSFTTLVIEFDSLNRVNSMTFWCYD